MKVVLVTPGWPARAFANGIASYIGNLHQGLAEEAVDPWVFAQAVAGGEIESQITDLSKFRYRPGVLRSIYNWLRPDSSNKTWTAEVSDRSAAAMIGAFHGLPDSFKPDLVEMDEAFGVAGLVAAQIKVPIVVRLHGPYFLTGPAMGADQDEAFSHRLELEREAIINSAGLTAPSMDLLQRVRQEYNVTLEHARVIPNPAPCVTAGDLWHAQPSDPNLVLFVGRFDRHKGGDLAIQAFVHLARERPSLRLAFVGPDHNYSTDDGRPLDLQGFLDETIPDASIRSRFEFYDQLPAAEITPLRQRAAVTLVASRWENFPMTVLEALAHGSPLVAPATGGVPEMLEHGSNGLLFEPENVQAIASSLAQMLDSPDLAKRCGTGALETIRQKFSIEVVARETREYYASLLRTHTQ